MVNKSLYQHVLGGILLLGLVLTSCSPATAQVVTVVVEVTSTPLPATPAPPPTATDTPAPPTEAAPTDTISLTDTSAATLADTAAPTLTNTPVPTRTLIPSSTPILLLSVPIEGGDPSHKFYAMLVYPNFKVAGMAKLWFRVYAHYPTSAKKDGEGIDTVDFSFDNNNGSSHYEHVEKTAGYCSFGGGEPDCNILDLAKSNYTWPDGTQITGGSYTLSINVNTKPDSNGNFFNMNGQIEFSIKVP